MTIRHFPPLRHTPGSPYSSAIPASAYFNADSGYVHARCSHAAPQSYHSPMPSACHPPRALSSSNRCVYHRSKGSWRLSSARTSTTATTTTTARCSSNRVRPGRVVRCNAVTNMSRLTGTVLERWCWCWCSHEVRVFSPVLAIQYPHVTSQVLCRRQQNISIHVYTFIFIYPYPRSSTGGFTPYNCMLSSFLIEEIEHWSSLLIQIELRKVSAQAWKQHVKSGFVIDFMLVFSVNVRSMMPRREDLH